MLVKWKASYCNVWDCVDSVRANCGGLTNTFLSIVSKSVYSRPVAFVPRLLIVHVGARSAFESSVSLCIPIPSSFQTHPRSHSLVGKAASVYSWVGSAGGKSPALSRAEAVGRSCWNQWVCSRGEELLSGVQTCFGERVEFSRYH